MNKFIYLRTCLIGLCIVVLAACESKSVNLHIKANIKDAAVYINGKRVGSTPMAIMVAPGNLQVEVRQSGYKSFKKTYSLAAGSSKVIEADLYLKTVTIGKQVWMAKNLDLQVPNSSCHDDNPANCEKYGRLYTWEAAKRAAAKMPGWHLPTDAEWDQLCEALGGTYIDKDGWGYYRDIGRKLKQGGSSSFEALVAGDRNSGGYFGNLGGCGYF